jgi:translation machinery-associated protein 16
MKVLTDRYGRRTCKNVNPWYLPFISFIAREDEQLEEIQSQRRPGRPPSKAEERIAQRKDEDKREYRGGLWVPDVLSEEGRSRLENWSGDWGGLNLLRFVRVVKDGAIKPSTFPPKGLS